MKKLLIFLLLVIFSSLGLAQEIPTITNITTHAGDLVESDCFATSTDVFCVDAGTSLLKYEVSTETLSTVGSLSSNNLHNTWGFCIYESTSDMGYCFDHLSSGQDNFAFELDLGSETTLATYTDANPSNNLYPYCMIRPTTDEIWCHFSDDGVTSFLRYYDVSGDVWTNIGEILYADSYAYQGVACAFSDTNTLVCGGGEITNQTLVYDVLSNTTTVGVDLPIKGTGHTAIAVDGIIYFIGMDDWDTPTLLGGGQGKIVWYDPELDTTGMYDDDYLITGFGGWAVGDRVLYSIASYHTENYDEFNGVISYVWDEPEIPEEEGGLQPFNATHGMSDITGLVIDFGVEFGIQLIALVGVIALVGMLFWVQGRFK
jgi:hypothetical protein